jgi:enoyl-CoA hydratase
MRIRQLPMPVIAAIDGYALGGGAELAYAADIRIATDARFGNPETGLGIIAAAGATWRLPEIVGHARASELLLTGRMIDADTALSWGLVSAVHAPGALLAAAHEVADRIAANGPRATGTKRALLAPPDAHPAIELELQAELFDSAEKHRRMTAFLERRQRKDLAHDLDPRPRRRPRRRPHGRRDRARVPPRRQPGAVIERDDAAAAAAAQRIGDSLPARSSAAAPTADRATSKPR